MPKGGMQCGEVAWWNGICVAPGSPHRVAGIASVSTQPRSCSAASPSAHASSVSSRVSAVTEHALWRRSTRAKLYTLPKTRARVDSTENSNFGYIAPAPEKIGGSFAPAISSCCAQNFHRPTILRTNRSSVIF